MRLVGAGGGQGLRCPSLRAPLYFSRALAARRHNVPINTQQAPVKRRCPTARGQQRQQAPHLAVGSACSYPSTPCSGLQPRASLLRHHGVRQDAAFLSSGGTPLSRQGIG